MWMTMADSQINERARCRWERDGTLGRTGVDDPGECKAAPCRQLGTDVGLPGGSLMSATAADNWTRIVAKRQGNAKSAAQRENKIRRAKVRRRKREAKLVAKAATKEAAKAATKAARARDPKKPKVAKKGPVHCPKCGKEGHKTARARDCWFHLGAEADWRWEGKPPEGQAHPSPGGFGVSDFADAAAGAGFFMGVADHVDGPPSVGTGPSVAAEPSQTPSQQPVGPVVATGIRAPVTTSRGGTMVRVPSQKGTPLGVGWATKAA